VGMMNGARRVNAVAISLALASCTRTQAEFNRKPTAVSKAALCKTALETQDPVFQQQLVTELGRRSLDISACEQMVLQQKQAAAALVAVALVGTALRSAQPETAAVETTTARLADIRGTAIPTTIEPQTARFAAREARCLGLAGSDRFAVTG